MAHSLKPLDQQVIVITGASSGMGLATARTAAKRGAKVVLAARSEDVLDEVVNEITDAGSEVSEAAVPLIGMYTASKHAVKGFTDALRVEVEEVDKAPVSITLIQPTATDTPFPQNARNYMDKEPKLPEPWDDPQDVVDAILDAAVTPTRSKKVGAMSKVNTFVAKVMPGVGDKMAAKQYDRQQYDERPRDPDGALYKPSESGQVHGSGGVKPK